MSVPVNVNYRVRVWITRVDKEKARVKVAVVDDLCIVIRNDSQNESATCCVSSLNLSSSVALFLSLSTSLTI